jgi:hypothetical protein
MPTTTVGAAAPISFVRLGPFYRLQRRVGLLDDGDLAAGRRALIFVALAWLPCLLLAIVEGRALGPHGIVGDFSAYAFALALAAFVLMEQSSDARMTSLVEQFTARGIARESAREGLSRARRNMERRTGAWAAEAALVVLAYLLSHAWMVRAAQGAEDGAWIGRLAADGGLLPSLAGWWVLLVALPLYWFLFGRWLWRFLTWGLMLRDIARCDLQLVATHPDRCGGLAFIGQYPKTYVLFVFAVSTVVASTVLKMIIHGGASLLSFKFALFGMIAFFAITFVVPLFAFTPMLVALKRAGLIRYGALLSQHNLAFEARWLEAPEGGAGLLGNPDVSSLADLAAGYDRVKDMRSAPVTKESIAPIVLAALAPMAGVAATQVPVSQILAAVKGLLML